MILIRYILFSILIFVFESSFIYSQTLFDNYYKTGFVNVRTSDPICNLDSSTVLLTYIVDSTTGRQDAGFIKVDKFGNEISQNSFNLFNRYNSGFKGMKNFIEGTACSYLLSTSTSMFNRYALVLTKVNKKTLDTMKVAIYYDQNYSLSMNHITKFSNNKYLLLGNKWDNSTNQPIIFQLDSNLIITDTINVTNTPINYVYDNAVWEMHSKKYILHGKINESDRPIVLLKMDTLGVVSRSVTSLSSFTTIIGQTFFSNIDSSYLGIGARVDSIYGNNRLYKLTISKFDKNLNMIWLKTYGEAALYNGLWDGVVLNDGSIVCSGSYSKLTSSPMINMNQNGVILKVDKKGNLIWMREYDHEPAGNYWECFYGIEQTKEGGFIAGGNIVNMPKAKAWVVQTDSEGCVLPGCASSTITVDSIPVPPPTPLDTSTVGLNKRLNKNINWKLFPNPAQNTLNVQIDGLTDFKSFDIRLFSMLGQEVKKIELHKRTESIDISELQLGMYLVLIYQDKVLIGNTKIEITK